MKREISLTRGKKALVDEEDYKFLSQWSWSAVPGNSGVWYAKRAVKASPKTIAMHREVILAGPCDIVDHIDGNGLNNVRANLRFVTAAESAINTRKAVGKFTSNFKGVSWDSRSKRWRVQIRIDGRKTSIGHFDCEIKAADAYNLAAVKFHGNIAVLNNI